MELRESDRDVLIREIRDALERGCPGSHTRLLGSLAAGTADRFSDIDVEWQVSARQLARRVAGVRETLDAVRRGVAAVRSDPERHSSDRERLLFVRFTGVPLYWRLDLVVRSTEAAHPPPVDPPDGDGAWSPAASALANAVGALKSVARDRPETARGLLDRGFARVGSARRATGDWSEDVRGLARAAVRSEPDQAALGAEVERLASEPW